MFGLGMPELIIILVLALVIFGAGKLPEIGTSLGKSIRAFKQAAEAPESKTELPAPPPAAGPVNPPPRNPTSSDEGGVPSPGEKPNGE